MKIGSLFTGTGALDMAVDDAFGDTETAWVSDIDKGARKILDHRFADVPNLGDITKVDWSDVEPVDIITGGTPCQDLSHAGNRAGMTEGTRSNLWVAMREAIAQLTPSYVIWENVRGAFTARADSGLEPCPRCVGDASGTNLRALGRVLGDLSSLGYDTQWRGIRASDVGACHIRFRIFIVATSADARRDAGIIGRRPGAGEAEELGRGRPANGNRENLKLLPTPAVNDMGSSKTLEYWDEWAPRQKAADGRAAPHGKSLSIEARRLTLLPTPSAALAEGGQTSRSGARKDELLLGGIATDAMTFGQYAPAVARWASVIGRPPPLPTEPTGKDGAERLSPRFVEWMMGLPDGWVADVPDMTRNQMLKACGNGVVRQQAHSAIAHMLAHEAAS